MSGVLGHIFPANPGGPALPEVPAIRAAAGRIVPAIQALQVVPVTPRQQAAISRRGAPGQCQASQAYLKLLTHRPELGRGLGITPEQMARVIAKDGGYDTLTHELAVAGRAVRGALALCAGRISQQVQTVLAFANERMAQDGADLGGWRNAFLPIGTAQAEQAGKAQHQERRGQRLQKSRAAGHPGDVPAAKTSKGRSRRVPARQALLGLRQGGGAAALDRFLQVPDAVDDQAANTARGLVRQLGLGDLDPGLVQGMRLAQSPRALQVAGAVVTALREWPPAEQAGVTADELAGNLDRLIPLGELDEALSWARDKVRTGRQVLETWQAAAQDEIAGAFLQALARAPDRTAWLALVLDGSEVIDLEEARLRDLLKVRQKNAARRQDLRDQAARTEKETQLLQVLQDIRDKKPVPPELLAEMARFYAENPDILA